MKLLLDTHIFFWFFVDDKRLSKQAIDSILSNANIKYVSILSLWEFAIKKTLNKIDTKNDLDRVEFLISENGFQLLDLNPEHCRQLLTLPLYHRDPFDRMLIAKAIVEGFTIITEDPHFKQYTVKVL